MKNKMIVLFTGVLLSILLGFVFQQNIIEYEMEVYNTESLFENTEYDYLVPAPSKEQVDTMKLSSNVNDVVPYYVFEMDILLNGDSEFVKVISIDSDEFTYTSYSDSRLIEQTDYSGNYALIDYELASELDIELGDIFTVTVGVDSTEIEYTIVGLYETNTLYPNGTIVIPYTGVFETEINELYTDTNLPYTEAYVSVENKEKFKTDYLNDYQGLGLKKERTEFDSDLEYQTYLDTFNSIDFQVQIVDMGARLVDLQDENQVNASARMNLILLISGITVVVFLGIRIIDLFVRKEGIEKSIPKGNYDLKQESKSLWIDSGLYTGGFIIVLSLIKYLQINMLKDFYHSSLYLESILITLCIVFILCLLITGVFVYVFKQLVLVNSKKIKKTSENLSKKDI